MKILFATSNAGKMKEIRMILEDLGVTVESLKDAGLQDVKIVEDGKSFEENALIKVNALRPYTDAVILADDSGLVVDALDGEPGIYSARYMGEDTSYDIKNKNIIDRVNASNRPREARFVCAIAASIPTKDGEAVTKVTLGTMEGEIALSPAGCGGFGYDPILFLPEYNKTSAELTPEEKNAISHRGKALRSMKEILKDYQEGTL